MAQQQTPVKMYRYRIEHEMLGTVELEAKGNLDAIVGAAKEWSQRWTEIARQCKVTNMGEVKNDGVIKNADTKERAGQGTGSKTGKKRTGSPAK